MLYARRSLSYQLSIRVVRRAAVAIAYPWRDSSWVARNALLRDYLRNAQEVGLRSYLQLDEFTHRNTDGPHNPYAKVYSVREVSEDFPDFEVVDHTQWYLHAPPLPVRRLPLPEKLVGWHLWVWLRARV